MEGGRETFRCPNCGKGFVYWVAASNPQPKVKCYFCAKESFPRGEPAPAPAAPKPAPTAAPAPAPVAKAPEPAPN